MKHSERGHLDNSKERRLHKKPYIAPQLIIHGDVEEITKSLGGAGSDGQGGSQLGDGV